MAGASEKRVAAGRMLAALSALSVLACSSSSPEVVVAFDADETLRPLVERLWFRLSDSEGEVVDERVVEIAEWPAFVLRLRPRDGDPTRRYTVEAMALGEDDVSLGAQQIEGGYRAGETREVWVVFDASCRDRDCRTGFRCQEGRCVEACVEPTVPDGVTRSRPVSCEEPCTGARCLGDVTTRCEDGAMIVDRECILGCGDPNACQEVLASNLGEVVGAAPRFGDLVIPAGESHQLGDNGEIRGIRPPGEFANGVGWREENVSGGRYQVLEMRDFRVEEGARLAFASAVPVILLVHGEAVVEGSLTVALPGGVRGGPGATPIPNADGGGAGASYGGEGGAGGDGPLEAGDDATRATYGTPELVPLLTGSTAGVSRGGGALQVSARFRIAIGEEGTILANGGFASPCSGGGSGGAILLEAPIVDVRGSVWANGARGGNAITREQPLVTCESEDECRCEGFSTASCEGGCEVVGGGRYCISRPRGGGGATSSAPGGNGGPGEVCGGGGGGGGTRSHQQRARGQRLVVS